MIFQSEFGQRKARQVLFSHALVLLCSEAGFGRLPRAVQCRAGVGRHCFPNRCCSCQQLFASLLCSICSAGGLCPSTQFLPPSGASCSSAHLLCVTGSSDSCCSLEHLPTKQNQTQRAAPRIRKAHFEAKGPECSHSLTDCRIWHQEHRVLNVHRCSPGSKRMLCFLFAALS